MMFFSSQIASSTQHQVMQVVVPPGLVPGNVFIASTHVGPVQVVVPQGLPVTPAGTQVMHIRVPVQQQQQQQQQQISVQPVVMPQAQMMQPLVVNPVAVALAAPQPMVMQQVVPAAAAQTQVAASKAVTSPTPAATTEFAPGPSGCGLYRVLLNPTGKSGEGCCDASASPVRQLAKRNLPSQLVGVVSPEAWELIIEKLFEWQTMVGPFPLPICELACSFSAGCCIFAPCLMFQYANRNSWENNTQEQINAMLQQYKVQLRFEKEGACCCCVQHYAHIVWR